MIKTSKQLKDKVRNISDSDSSKAQILIRNFMMERFLERISVSRYSENFILKGGMLVASIIGLDSRTTMDIDTTIRSIPLSSQTASKLIDEIIHVGLSDGVSFRVTKHSEIMEGLKYPGIRFFIEGSLDRLKQTIKIDISTGDVITPEAVHISYQLMFEDRSIQIWAYNLETLLSEKLETIMSRSTANTRIRDFYDIYLILAVEKDNINRIDFNQAFHAPCDMRPTSGLIHQIESTINDIRQNGSMRLAWESFARDNHYVENAEWDLVLDSVYDLVDWID